MRLAISALSVSVSTIALLIHFSLFSSIPHLCYSFVTTGRVNGVDGLQMLKILRFLRKNAAYSRRRRIKPLHNHPLAPYNNGVTLCNYGNKRCYGISGLDPGAEPGASTEVRELGKRSEPYEHFALRSLGVEGLSRSR